MINPSNDEAHISINKGISVLPGTSTSPDKVERPAPPAIDIEPPKPEAAPANCFAWFMMARISLEQSSRRSDLDSVSF